MTAQQEFWKWFIEHEKELFEVDPGLEAERERIFSLLASELQRIDPNLTFEFGPNKPKREFIISAGGIKQAFPMVTSLVNSAPPFHRWQVIAFRPRRMFATVVEFQGKRVDPKDVQFSLLDNGGMAGLYLFIPNFKEDDAGFKQIGYLLLDETLGEYDVETRLGLIKMFKPETPTNGRRYPLSDLANRFDQLIASLEKRSRKPS